MRLISLTAAALFAFLIPTAAFAQDFSSLEERMTYNEFKAAGLEKLTPEELAALNAWLSNRAPVATTQQAVPQTQDDRRGFSQSFQSNEEFTSRILGTFKGWNGSKTEFKLENGMVWKSTDPAAKLSVNLTDPTVTLTPGFFDAWFLQVEGYNAKVRVIRIK